MHRHPGSEEPVSLIVLPGGSPDVIDTHVGPKMAMLFGGIVAIGVLISAFLLNQD